jgi:hypothetical protein
LIDRMHAMAGQPIHVLDRMVDLVKAPQKRAGVKKPMRAVKAKISQNNRRRGRNPQR